MPDYEDTQEVEQENPETGVAVQLPTGISALRQAVDFVARGRPISEDMVASLERMLANAPERLDLLKVVFQHVQVERLRNLMEGLALVEGRVFHPAMVANYTNRELLDLFKAAQGELRAVAGYLETSNKGMASTPENVKEVADPAKAEERKNAEEAVGVLSPKQRSNVKALLEKVLGADNRVIEVNAKPTP